jgi:hypothetical protein
MSRAVVPHSSPSSRADINYTAIEKSTAKQFCPNDLLSGED